MNYAALIGIWKEAIATKGFSTSGAKGKVQFKGFFLFPKERKKKKQDKKIPTISV